MDLWEIPKIDILIIGDNSNPNPAGGGNGLPGGDGPNRRRPPVFGIFKRLLRGEKNRATLEARKMSRRMQTHPIGNNGNHISEFITYDSETGELVCYQWEHNAGIQTSQEATVFHKKPSGVYDDTFVCYPTHEGVQFLKIQEN